MNDARANVELPINVNIPWSVTNPYNTSWLSKICQVIAHIAPIKFGTIAKLNQKNKLYSLYVEILYTTKMVNIHSMTEEMWINQVPNESSCKIYIFFFSTLSTSLAWFIGKTLIHLYEISPSGEIKKVFLSENGGIQEPYFSLIIPSGSDNKV